FVNTCSIREKAARRVVGHLKRLRCVKKKNPSLILGVGGCVAEQEGRALIEEVPWLSLVVGPGRLEEIPDLLETMTAASPPVVLAGQAEPPEIKPGESQVAVSAGFSSSASPGSLEGSSERASLSSSMSSSMNPSWDPEAEGPLSGAAKPKDSLGEEDFFPVKAPVSSFLTIMRGCDNYCAYCVVPYLRGRENSRPIAEIVAEAAGLIKRGAREITLLGQNVNSYGRPGGRDFVKLLREVGTLPGLERLRFTTSHPKDFPPELVRLFGDLPTLCEHLHLPLQAGSDKILKAMGRRYGKARYLELVESLREAKPNLALTTDIIVGFPGEAEEDFAETLDVLSKVRFDSIYSFKYSDRPMTKANSLSGKIDESEKSRRLDLVQTLQREITLEKHRSYQGQEVEVLIERLGRNLGQLRGHTRDFKTVNFDGSYKLIGRLARVEIDEGWPACLLGRMVGEPY
ncbi:MAG: MiaB/RimO family radical SAM methylthiotransferase, partial [Deltaproteobacteria bacterium]|nr:MiaB/RimO family radical SAM methylthiotransferase [Deltaproteobacteria bacterium]